MAENDDKQHMMIYLCIVCTVLYVLGLLWPLCGFLMGVFIQERYPETSGLILDSVRSLNTIPTQWIEKQFRKIP